MEPRLKRWCLER